jgi:hypothetical protein
MVLQAKIDVAVDLDICAVVLKGPIVGQDVSTVETIDITDGLPEPRSPVI